MESNAAAGGRVAEENHQQVGAENWLTRSQNPMPGDASRGVAKKRKKAKLKNRKKRTRWKKCQMKRAFCMSKRANSPARTRSRRSRGSCRCRSSDGAGEERLLAAQEVLKSRLLLSPFEEFALTLDFKLSKVARADGPPPPRPLLPLVTIPTGLGAFFGSAKNRCIL